MLSQGRVRWGAQLKNRRYRGANVGTAGCTVGVSYLLVDGVDDELLEVGVLRRVQLRGGEGGVVPLAAGEGGACQVEQLGVGGLTGHGKLDLVPTPGVALGALEPDGEGVAGVGKDVPGRPYAAACVELDVPISVLVRLCGRGFLCDGLLCVQMHVLMCI